MLLLNLSLSSTIEALRQFVLNILHIYGEDWDA